jgi:hypothetical protein
MLTTVSASSVPTSQTDPLCNTCITVVAANQIDPFCDTCIAVVNLTDYFIRENNLTLQIVETFVETMCKLIGGGIVTKECDYVIDIIQDIYNLLDSGITPQQVCTFFKLCSPKNKLALLHNEKDSIGYNSSLDHHHN